MCLCWLRAAFEIFVDDEFQPLRQPPKEAITDEGQHKSTVIMFYSIFILIDLVVIVYMFSVTSIDAVQTAPSATIVNPTAPLVVSGVPLTFVKQHVFAAAEVGCVRTYDVVPRNIYCHPWIFIVGTLLSLSFYCFT